MGLARMSSSSAIRSSAIGPGPLGMAETRPRAEAPARIVVNSRTGTVIISTQVHITPVAVAHGNLTVTISENAEVSQPGPFARRGNTEVVQQSSVAISEEPARMFLFKPGVKLDDVVRAVNQVGAAPSDLVAILEALKQAGKKKAEQIRQTGAKIVVTNCFNCMTQIRDLSKAYDLGIEVKSIVELVSESLIM